MAAEHGIYRLATLTGSSGHPLEIQASLAENSAAEFRGEGHI
jgi:hypothetical protein